MDRADTTKFLIQAIEIFGNQRKLAAAMGVVQSAISQWLTNNRVPPIRAIMIERLTNGAVKREELRPDIFCD